MLYIFSPLDTCFRGKFLDVVAEEKQVKSKLKELAPSTDLLFGGKIKDLASDIKDIMDVIMAKKSFKKKGSWKPQSKYQQQHNVGRGYYHHRGAYGSGGGFSRAPGPAPRGRGATRGRGGRGGALKSYNEN